MYKESETMKDVHRIQEKIYEQTKNMTSQEFIAHIHKRAETFKKKHGLHLHKASRLHK